MTRRTKIIITVSVIIIIIIILLIWFFGRSSGDIDDNIPTVGGDRKDTIVDVLEDEQPPPVFTKEPSTQSTLLATAHTFAERFGSYSNQSNASNLRDLWVLMTKRMQQESQSILDDASSVSEASEFFGVTTKALNSQIITLNDSETEAQVVINTQRAETTGTAQQPRIYYQNIMLTLVFDGAWKVDRAEWK